MRNPNARVCDPGSFNTAPGSRIHVIHEPRFDGQTLRVVATGSEDIQDKIEAYAPYTDINYMLHRLQVGDNSVVTCRQALYGDFTGLPSDPIEAINLVHTAESRFGTMSVEDKAKYNNDYRVWLASVLKGEATTSPVSVPVAESTVKEIVDES